LENKRESSVDSRASSIERARGRKESRA
jgi:hypothetical protein